MTESGNAFVISLKGINAKNSAPLLGVVFMINTHLGMLRKEIVNENLHNLIFCKHEVKSFT